MYSDNKYYREYQRMLVKLHELIAEGNGDSDAAIELREEMEETEGHLSPEEIIRLNALSGDLSMMHGREIPDPDVAGRVSPADVSGQLMQAFKREDWSELLALLRVDVSKFLRPGQVAYMRSRAYLALGEITPAIAFIDEASRRDAASVNFRALAMKLLWKDQRYNEAYARAKAYLAEPKTPSRLLLMAAGIVSLQSQQDHPPDDLMAVANQAIGCIERALPDEKTPGIRFEGLVTLGLLAAYIGDRNKAESAIMNAMSLESGIVDQLAMRGLLFDELNLIRQGQMQSVNARSLARQLADAIVPQYADAA
jgi:tetratricopeptide (TPR) repeat protein